MDINFFDDPLEGPKSREAVRIKSIGIYIHEERRMLSFGIELTPFLERPSIEMKMINATGEDAGSLSVIETLTPNFSLIVHFRDQEMTNPYRLLAVVYYATPDTERVDVDRQEIEFSAAAPGEQIFKFGNA